MPWLDEVHALDVVMTRPVIPKKTPTFTGVVCAIILRYVFGLMPSIFFSSSILAKSGRTDGLPADDP